MDICDRRRRCGRARGQNQSRELPILSFQMNPDWELGAGRGMDPGSTSCVSHVWRYWPRRRSVTTREEAPASAGIAVTRTPVSGEGWATSGVPQKRQSDGLSALRALGPLGSTSACSGPGQGPGFQFHGGCGVSGQAQGLSESPDGAFPCGLLRNSSAAAAQRACAPCLSRRLGGGGRERSRNQALCSRGERDNRAAHVGNARPAGAEEEEGMRLAPLGICASQEATRADLEKGTRPVSEAEWSCETSLPTRSRVTWSPVCHLRNQSALRPRCPLR